MLGGQGVIKNLNYVLHVNQENGKRIKMGNRIDLTGRQFGRLTIIAYAGTTCKAGRSTATWKCKCNCGKDTIVRSGDLLSGKTKSCGCLWEEHSKKGNLKHGYKGTATYKTWQDMKDRCNNPNNKSYKYYGGRGISVCKKWESFTAFLRDMGEKPVGLTIERINNNKGYYPANCKFATRAEQNINTRQTHKIKYNGKIRCLKEWSELLGINYNTLWYRLSKYPPEIAFNM